MFLGTLFTSISYSAWKWCSAKKALFYDTSVQAKMISSNIKCSLAFNDIKDANDILNSLKIQYFVVFAGIYDGQGNLFASYYRRDVNQATFKPPPPTKARFKFRNGYIIVTEPVIDEKEIIGTVCLWAKP